MNFKGLSGEVSFESEAPKSASGEKGGKDGSRGERSLPPEQDSQQVRNERGEGAGGKIVAEENAVCYQSKTVSRYKGNEGRGVVAEKNAVCHLSETVCRYNFVVFPKRFFKVVA